MAGKMKIKTRLDKSLEKSGMEFLVQICIRNANCVRDHGGKRHRVRVGTEAAEPRTLGSQKRGHDFRCHIRGQEPGSLSHSAPSVFPQCVPRAFKAAAGSCP